MEPGGLKPLFSQASALSVLTLPLTSKHGTCKTVKALTFSQKSPKRFMWFPLHSKGLTPLFSQAIDTH